MVFGLVKAIRFQLTIALTLLLLTLPPPEYRLTCIVFGVVCGPVETIRLHFAADNHDAAEKIVNCNIMV